MNDAKKEKVKKNLVRAGLMAEDDVLIDGIQTNRYEKLLGPMGSWKQGWGYFTETRFIWTGNGKDLSIPYKEIRGLDKFSLMLIPTGIKIVHQPAGKEDLVIEQVVMTGRKKWLALLSEKSGAPCP